MRASEIPAEIVSVGHFLTRAQAAHAVGVHGHDVLAMQGLLRLGSRFAIQECYPAFMFHGHLEEFRDVVSRFDGADPWQVLGWMNEVRPELGGRSPDSLDGQAGTSLSPVMCDTSLASLR